MTTREYLIVELPRLEAPTHAPGISSPVQALDNEGEARLGGHRPDSPAPTEGSRAAQKAPSPSETSIARRRR